MIKQRKSHSSELLEDRMHIVRTSINSRRQTDRNRIFILEMNEEKNNDNRLNVQATHAPAKPACRQH